LASAGRLDTDLQTFIEERLNEEREYVDDYGQSAGEEERVKIKTEIQERSGRIVRIEVREEEGRLRIRVREPDEVEERKEGRDDKREDESRPEDGEREEAAGRSDNQDEKSGDDKNESVERDPSAAQKKEESSQSGSGTKSSAKSGTTTSGSASQSTTSSQGTSSSPSQEDNESSHEADEDQESNTETYISESSARSKALAAVPGMVKDSDLKEVDNKKVWEVRVQRSSDNEEVKVLVDAKTGSIVKIDD
jgi:uncharacterized membrane protein YkoI